MARSRIQVGLRSRYRSSRFWQQPNRPAGGGSTNSSPPGRSNAVTGELLAEGRSTCPSGGAVLWNRPIQCPHRSAGNEALVWAAFKKISFADDGNLFFQPRSHTRDT